MLEVGAFHPSWGHIHLGPTNALEAHALLGGGAFLPVHWGTFSLAIHAWDEPAETLMSLGAGTQLVMPRLGEAVEPAHDERVTPWWRAVDGRGRRREGAGRRADDAAEGGAVSARLKPDAAMYAGPIVEGCGASPTQARPFGNSSRSRPDSPLTHQCSLVTERRRYAPCSKPVPGIPAEMTRYDNVLSYDKSRGVKC